MDIQKLRCAPLLAASYWRRYEALKLQVKFISILLFMFQAAIATAEYPGLPPDCWSESRNVHSGVPDSWKQLEKNLKFSHILEEPTGEKVYSQNKGYYFVVDGFRPESQVTIFTEKEQYWKLSFTENFYPAKPDWVNEKILFLRVYWGRIAFEDILIDVEKEMILYSESGTDLDIAFQQYQDGCSFECQVSHSNIPTIFLPMIIFCEK